jgi:glycosyltransferase involved in cell wall biosynthesis
MACRISVQICTYNGRDIARRCVAAVGRVRFAADACEIVVVDDGSHDGTADAIAGMQVPLPLRVLRMPHRGLAAARNTGIEAAQGEIVLFIDQDEIPDPGLLQEHWLSHQSHDRLVVMGWVRHVSGEDRGRRLPRLADFSTSFFWTSNVSVRRRHLVEAGLFDEDFTEYGWEDLEFGDRLRALGLRRVWCRRAIVDHVKPTPRARDLDAIIARAEASGRSAVIYLGKQPTTRTRMATGLTAARRAAWRAIDPAEPWLRRTIGRGDRQLGPAGRAAAYLVAGMHFHRSASRALAARGEPPIASRR